MNEKQPAVGFPGLFYDVLSGKFKPNTDPRGNTHRLARLCVAATQKGAETKTEEGLYVSQYSPSWAKHVGIAVIKTPSVSTKKLVFPQQVMQIGLHNHQNDRDLTIGLDDIAQANSITVISDDEKTRLPLELGRDLAEARMHVVRAAEHLFDVPQR